MASEEQKPLWKNLLGKKTQFLRPQTAAHNVPTSFTDNDETQIKISEIEEGSITINDSKKTSTQNGNGSCDSSPKNSFIKNLAVSLHQKHVNFLR